MEEEKLEDTPPENEETAEEPITQETAEEPTTQSEPSEPEQPCDPTTMTCDEIQNKVIKELIPQSVKYASSIEKLDEVKRSIPTPEVDKAYNEAVDKKKQIDEEIYGLFEKYTVCKKPLEPPEETLE